ncbi:MAG: hypothetical protein IKR19_08135 [Acholeplasmatales bacterium]|nr:hypothetical protein [Acholeplasmatales bacterium]
MATNQSTITDWNINTDIYAISDNINKLQKRYIEDEDETTLSMGIFGFVADTEAKKIQIATIMAGQLGNEMFPTRAKLTKNVLSHAVYHNIEGINAKPASMAVTFCIKVSDVDRYIIDDHFYLEADCPIFIDRYEFHFDYDIMVTRKKAASGGWSYSAQYIVSDENDIPIVNRLSDITHPYLKQPFLITIGQDEFIGIQCTIRQCSIEKIDDIMISDSIITNRTYEFQFDNQMADFTVVVEDNNQEYRLTPYLYGMNVDDRELYCWYLYVSDDTIRITFDSRSFLPSLNSKIHIKSWTTRGAEGNFEYLNVDGTGEGVYVDLTSEHYNYSLITAYMEALTDAVNGSDRKTKEELQKLIPKAALARGSVTTEADLINYFDLINNETNRLVMQKKVDNQLARVWYGYFLLKDDYDNVIPSNTINLKLVLNSGFLIKCNDGRYILPAGSVLRYDETTRIAEVIDDSAVPALNLPEYFIPGTYYYMTVYNIVLSRDPLYCAYYLTNRNLNSYFLYEYVNDQSDVQFIANHFHFERLLLVDQDQYSISFTIAQSIINDGLEVYDYQNVSYTDSNGNTITETIVTENIKVVIVLFGDDGETPYRWCEADLVTADRVNYYYSFKKEIVTDSQFDDQNRIRLLGLNEAGTTKQVYGYFGQDTRMDIYILAKVSSADMDYPRKDLDNIAPGYEDFVVTNIYTAVDGISFYNDFTPVLNSKVKVDDFTDTVYTVYGVPVIGRHYMTDEKAVKYLLEAIDERKAYIDYCLQIVENNMNIDFKFFNTYGPSSTYTLEDRETFIKNVDLEMRFKVSLKDESDIATKNSIIRSIKALIEDLYDTGDWHSSNLIQSIMNEYDDRINFIEFVGFNEFDADDQHIIKVEVEDPTTVPEFLCIRNILNTETLELEPCIYIETVL